MQGVTVVDHRVKDTAPRASVPPLGESGGDRGLGAERGDLACQPPALPGERGGARLLADQARPRHRLGVRGGDRVRVPGVRDVMTSHNQRREVEELGGRIARRDRRRKAAAAPAEAEGPGGAVRRAGPPA